MEEKAHLSIYLGHHSKAVRDETAALLARLGHSVEFSTGFGIELIRKCIGKQPDLVIASRELLDMDALVMLKEAYRYAPFPVILITATQEESSLRTELLDGNIMVCLAEPLREDDLRVNIPVVFQRFREFQALWNENCLLKDALETRKVIEKAKGILMRNAGMDEHEAYNFIKARARDNRTRMAEIARRIIRGDWPAAPD